MAVTQLVEQQSMNQEAGGSIPNTDNTQTHQRIVIKKRMKDLNEIKISML